VEAGVVGSRIVACHRGPLGDWLQSRAAQRTADLKPAHQWVPWLVVNGVPLLDYAEAVQQVGAARMVAARPACHDPRVQWLGRVRGCRCGWVRPPCKRWPAP